VIISAGYRIGPFEVESACVEHPAVKEAAAVASPDERRGQHREGVHRADRLVRAERRAGRRDQAPRAVSATPAYAYPRVIEFVDDLPKTLTGKIRRVELREREFQR
jgi:acetyl-CoA synthetase